MTEELDVPAAPRGSLLQLGVDIVSVSEVSRSLERFGERYVRRVFTAREAAYCRAGAGQVAAARFAVRFAAKEATLKALRPEAPSGDWRSIEVRRHDPSGWCDVVLHGEMAALAVHQGIETLALSMSHDEDHAMAVVVAQAAAHASHEEPRHLPRPGASRMKQVFAGLGRCLRPAERGKRNTAAAKRSRHDGVLCGLRRSFAA